MRARINSDGRPHVSAGARLERRNGLLIAVTDTPGFAPANQVRALIEAIRAEQLELEMAAIDRKAARG